MGLWRDKTRGDWRYEFLLNRRRYAGGGFRTKAEARAAREERRKELKAFTRAEPPRTQTGMGFVEASNLYLDWSVRRHAKKTYEYKAMVCREFLAVHGDLPISSIGPMEIHSYLSSRPTNHNYNVHRKELCALFNWSMKHNGAPKINPCVDVERMPEEQKRREIPTHEEFLRIIAACKPDERPLLAILAHSLARIDEILRLTWQDVNFERRTLTLWTRKNKDGEWKSRHIPMNRDLASMLMSMWKRRRQEKWVFWNAKEDNRYNRRPKLMRALCRRAGTGYYGFHAVRHFISTYLHDIKKVPTGVLSGLLGHESKRTTEIYLHSVDEAARLAMGELEGLFMLVDNACGFDEKEPQTRVNDGVEA